MRNRLRGAWLIIATAFRADPWRALGMFLLSALSELASTLMALWLKFVIDGVVAGDESKVVAAAIAIGVSKAFSDVAIWSSWKIRVVLQERTSLLIDQRMVEITGGLPGLEHHERPEYLDRLDLLRAQRDYLAVALGVLVNAVGLVVRLATTAALLISLHPLLILLPVFAIPSIWVAGRSANLVQEAYAATIERERRARHLFALNMAPASAKELRIFDLSPHLVREHGQLWGEIDAVRTSAGLRAALFSAIGWFVFFLGYGGSVLFITYEAVHQRAGLGDVALAVTLAAQVRGYVSGAVDLTNSLMAMLNVVGHYLFLLDYATQATAGEGGAVRRAVSPSPLPDQLAVGITLSGVSFTYPGTEEPVLRDLDLHIPAGSTVALVGENGAGKTTLVKLLCRFYEPTAGSITVDGVALSDFDVESWRDHISAGFQDYARFEFEARQVVGVGDLGRVDDEPAVREALAKAGAEEIEGSLPHGLDTQLGRSFEGGVDVSGGQWQKLALGRAMMRSAPILLVLDEPTASLDAQTEHALFERYARAARGVSTANGGITLLVSHRFTTLKMADLIVVIDDGRIAEAGCHEELMARRGLYAELHDIQARAYS